MEKYISKILEKFSYTPHIISLFVDILHHYGTCVGINEQILRNY